MFYGQELLLTKKTKSNPKKKETKSSQNETRFTQNETKFTKKMKPNIHKTESSMQKLKSDLHKMKLDPNMKMISLSSFSMVVHGGCGHNIDGGFHFSYINMETSARLSSLVGT